MIIANNYHKDWQLIFKPPKNWHIIVPLKTSNGLNLHVYMCTLLENHCLYGFFTPYGSIDKFKLMGIDVDNLENDIHVYFGATI